ncbi:hypothetical protein RMCBS344292_07788 [Rhizopus microsporus]|nr:hypothetical protein RMCBS344292_07788 [Rhizopus microsporus]
MLTCTDCEENFSSKDTLKRHKYERHCKKCTITITVEGICEKVIVERKNDILQCPFCNKEHLTREGIKSHIQKSKCKAALFNERTKTTKKRNYDTAVLNACGALLFEKSHQDQIFQLVDSMNLSPICLTTDQGEEVNALVHVNDVSQICNSNFTKAIPVSKKKKS